MIQFYDYQRRFPHARQDLMRIIRAQAASGEFILKSAVEELEARLREHSGARHAICVSSGTFALTLALKAHGIGPGDEVITPAFSYVASASAIVQAGATPVFVDVDGASFTLQPQAVARAIGSRTRAVMAVHLFSGLADMPALRAAMPAGMPLIEDSATAFGASQQGRAAGVLGDAGIYSFFPAKPLGGIGDGGAVITDDDAIATTVRMLRNHGQDGKTRFHHHLLGYNSRMDDINARWLCERLAHNPAELAQKQAIARHYDAALAPLAPRLQLQLRHTGDFSPHAYVIRSEQRDALAAHLKTRGIETKVHFPQPLPAQPAFATAQYQASDFPQAAALAQQTLAIPLHAQLQEHEVSAIIEAIREFHA